MSLHAPALHGTEERDIECERGGWKRTSLTCSRVRARGRVNGIRSRAAAAVAGTESGSVVVVAHEASLADVSNSELVSGLSLLDDASWRPSQHRYTFNSHG